MIHVYFMPGMAANSSIFEHINLPEEDFEIHLLDWFIPELDESLVSYAQRMCDRIAHQNPVLVGVSFGGMLVQEMAKIIRCHKVIVISSIKSYHELPVHLTFLRKTKTYNLLPTRLVANIDILAKYVFGDTIKKRMDLYKKYLSITDKRYIDWAIKEIVCWQQDQPIEGVIYIHGDKDAVFPNSCTAGTIVVKGGTHIMIINKYKWFNENLPKLIRES